MNKYFIYSLAIHIVAVAIFVSLSSLNPSPSVIKITLATLPPLKQNLPIPKETNIPKELPVEEKIEKPQQIIQQPIEKPKLASKPQTKGDFSDKNKPTTTKDVRNNTKINDFLQNDQPKAKKIITTKKFEPKINNPPAKKTIDIKPAVATIKNEQIETLPAPLNNNQQNKEDSQNAQPKKVFSKENIKDATFDNFLGKAGSEIADLPNDILKENNVYISDSEKNTIKDQISKCVGYVAEVKDQKSTIILQFDMHEDRTIKNVNVLRDKKVVAKAELSNFESRVIHLFNDNNCKMLLLPQDKYSYWKRFTIKINLRGFFE